MARLSLVVGIYQDGYLSADSHHPSSNQSAVFRGKFSQISRASLQNSMAHRGKIVQIL